MHIEVITIFPELFEGFLEASLIGKALESGDLTIDVHNLRNFTDDRHRTVDDEPYGGGVGMVMKAPAWIEAIRSISANKETWRVLLSPQGARLDDAKVRQLSDRRHLILMCGRYEGLDERVRKSAVDEEISIGDYVLSGGELPAMVLIEALSRQLPGVVGRPQSVEEDSFRSGLLDHPHYTRPRVVDGMEVPPVLISGDHEAVRAWRNREALRATLLKRPDLLADMELSESQRQQVEELTREKIGSDH